MGEEILKSVAEAFSLNVLKKNSEGRIVKCDLLSKSFFN